MEVGTGVKKSDCKEWVLSSETYLHYVFSEELFVGKRKNASTRRKKNKTEWFNGTESFAFAVLQIKLL